MTEPQPPSGAARTLPPPSVNGSAPATPAPATPAPQAPLRRLGARISSMLIERITQLRHMTRRDRRKSHAG